jgi:hypothetical protein
MKSGDLAKLRLGDGERAAMTLEIADNLTGSVGKRSQTTTASISALGFL